MEGNTYRRASKMDIFKYSFGGIGSNIPFLFVAQFAFVYFTTFLGIDPVTAATITAFPILIDAFTDPIMGMIADRTSTKIGKYRPYVIFGAPLLGITMILLFWDLNLSGTTQTVYLLAVYILYSLASTVANIPYHSLTAVLTEDPEQRTTVASAKQIVGMFGAIPVLALTPMLIKVFGGDAAAFLPIVLIYSVVTVLAFMLCASGAKNSDRPEIHAEYETKGEKISLKEQLSLIYKNKALLLLMVAFGTDMIAFGATQKTAYQYFLFYVGKPELAGLVGMMALIGLPVMFFLPIMTKKIGKKRLFIIGSTILMFLALWIKMIPATSINTILLQAALAGFVGPLTGILGWTMLADCVEYGEWVTGKRGAGTVTSQLTFINKLGQAVGVFLLGIMLSGAGFLEGSMNQPDSAITAIVNIRAFLPALGYLCSIIAMSFYPITEISFAKMVKENEIRRQKVVGL